VKLRAGGFATNGRGLSKHVAGGSGRAILAGGA
jgi:hypothetical protein